MIYAKNPILSGFYPDPSICRAGDDFYLVNSSFAYFPGVPIWHSKNLAQWRQIGNILDRNSQLPLTGCRHSNGIFAPTIRYYDGVYYMITTNISGGGNFIVTADYPEGPWSEPYFLGKEAQGIDPSLFIDTDGTGYYVGTRPNPEGVRYNGDWEIWVQKIDLAAMQLTGESHAVWKGALRDAIWPEGPHIYKKDDYYYLMIAEGGTGPNHAVTIARSKNIYGPYENNPNNPILTHRHLGRDYPVVYVGHGDLVDDTQGNWYMVMLASRKCEGYIGLGRETFLAKVAWEDGWPVVNPGIGKLEDTVELPYAGESSFTDKTQMLDAFPPDKRDVVMLRNPKCEFYENRNGKLRMYILPPTLKELASPAYLGFRQLEYYYNAVLEIEFGPLSDTEEAGFAIMQSNEYHMLFRIKCMGTPSGDKLALQVAKCTRLEEKVLAEDILPADDPDEESHGQLKKLRIKIKGHGQKADFIHTTDSGEIVLLKDADIHEMSTDIAGGFVGNTLGVYASSCGKESDNFIEIKEFTIRYTG